MSWPVTVLADGGMPVSESASGTPMTPMADGGMPVTIIEDGGMPVTFVDNDFQPLPQGYVGANIILPDSVHPSLTVARAGATATRIDSSGALQTVAADTLRRDYSNPNGDGILIEKAETNIIDDVRYADGWTLSGASASGTLTALDGTSISQFLASGASATHRAVSAFIDAYTGADIYTYSFDVKIPTGSDTAAIFARLRANSSGQTVRIGYSGGVWTFGVSAPFGAAAPPAITSTDMSVRYFSDGWARIYIVSQASSGTATFNQMDISWSVSTSETAAGTANTTIGLDNFQVSLGDNRGLSRIAAGATRAADDVSLALADMPQWNAAEGTFLVDFVAGPSVAAKHILDISNGTTSERIYLATGGGGTVSLVVYDGGVQQAAVTSAAVLVPFSRNKVAISFRANAFHLALNGVAATPDTSGTIPTPTKIQFGANRAKTASTFMNGHLRSVRYFAGELTTANLIALTS